MTPDAVAFSHPKHRNLLQSLLPWLVLLVMLAVVSGGVYRKAHAAKVPPVFDAFTFYSKAFYVWQEIKAGHPERVFATGQTTRPPGSTVITAPFGFRDVESDFKGFFFRNIMAPVWMWGAAAALLLIPLARGLSGRWLAAGALASLMAMPMFYQMEWNPAVARSYTWGFQDCVIASFAALAMALLLASIRRYRLWMSLSGGILLAWTIFIKPVGLLLMPLVFGQWLVEMLIQHWPLHARWRESSGGARRYARLTLIVLPLFFLSADLISFLSPYLSKENWSAANIGQGILRDIMSTWRVSDYLRELSWGMGYIWTLVTFLGVIWGLGIILRFLFLLRFDYRHLRAVYALLGLSAGLVWWVLMAGPMDRYMFPFQLCFFLGVFPPLWAKLQEKLVPAAKGLLATALFGPLFFLAFLLWSQPSSALQKAFRLNLSTGGYVYSISAAQTLLQHLDPSVKAIRYYKSDQSWSIGAMEGWLLTRRLAHPETPWLQAFCPLDWVRPILVRRKELVNSEFIVIERLPDPAPILARKEIPNADLEKELLTAWLGQLTPAQGVEVLQDGPLRLMQVINRPKLDQAFGEWMNAYKFRPEFYAENQGQAERLRLAFINGPVIFSYPNGHNQEITPASQAQVEDTPEGLRMHATGTDPQIQLPKVRAPERSRLVIRAKLYSPTANEAEFFWSTSATPGYHADRRANQTTGRGWNELYFELPAGADDYQLRFDPGTVAGDYLLQTLEIVALPEDGQKE